MTTHIHATQLGGVSQPLRIAIRPLTDDDRSYARATWSEGYKTSSTAFLRSPWPMFKATVGKQLQEALSAASTLGAYIDDGRLAGWLAYTPGRSVDTVHWLYTRAQLRGRGVAAALVAAAEIGNRVCYTHRGSRPTGHRGRQDRRPEAERHHAKGPTLDLALADWMRADGRSVVFVPYEEWRT